MPVAHGGHIGHYDGAPGTGLVIITLTGGAPVGALLLVRTYYSGSGSPGSTVDSKGNPYTIIGGGGPFFASILTTALVAGDTITVTSSTGRYSSNLEIDANYFTGLRANAVTTAVYTTAYPDPVSTSGPVQAGDLAVGFGNYGQFTLPHPPAAPWVDLPSYSADEAQYAIPTTTGTLTLTSVNPGTETMRIVVFHADSGSHLTMLV